jgi:N-acetylglutamate synthase-like GNAT family acetyltransferase
MSIEYKETIPKSNEYYNLFQTTGWNDDYKADENELHRGISNSWYSISAYSHNKELIGFGRIVSDGVLYALISDVIVDPANQKQGTGSAILENLIQRCKKSNIRVLWLFAASNKSNFYKKFGFSERPGNAPGMQLNLYKNS